MNHTVFNYHVSGNSPHEEEDHASAVRPSSPTESRRAYDLPPVPSRSPSPCLSTSSAGSSSGEARMANNGHHLLHHPHSAYGSLYMSHPVTTTSSGAYPSLPFPIPALASPFQLPMSLTKNASLHQQFANGIVVSTSGNFCRY